MNTLTLHFPEEKYQCLKQIAENKGISLHELFDEITTRMLEEFAAKTQFEQRASRGQGKTERGLQLLEKASKEFNDE